MPTEEEHEHEQEQPQADSPQTTTGKKKKSKKKKKRPKSRGKKQEEQTEGRTAGTEPEGPAPSIKPMPLLDPTPLVINSANWNRADGSQAEVCLPGLCHWLIDADFLKDKNGNEDGLQKFLSSHSHRLYAGDSDSPPSVTEFTPSTTTEATVRAHSVHGEKPAQQQQEQQPNVREQAPATFICPEHTRMLCQFIPGCCVHKPRACHYCPFPMSCCCAHHSGDCCYCAFSRGHGYDGDTGNKNSNNDGTNPETSAPAGPKQETVPSQKPAATSPESHNPPSTSATDTSLRTHTLALLQTETFADSRITLHSPNNSFYLTFRTHKALLARSPSLASILASLATSSSDGDNTSEVEIQALAGETFYMVKAFETALQNLYGLPFLNRQNLPRFTMMAMGYTGEDVHKMALGMSNAVADFAICYAVSGAFLGVPGIVEVGMKLAMDALDWENIEMVLHFALSASRYIITCPGHPSSAPLTAEQDLMENWIPLLTTWVLTFMASYLEHLQQQEQPFNVYISARCQCMPDRIPEHLRSVPGSILSNPKLAEVKFGSFATLEEQKPSPEIIRLSAILIGLPYNLLKEAFGIMVEKGVLDEDMASTIVIEREARRLYALRVWGNQPMEHGGSGVDDDEQVKELGYRELVTRKNGKVLLERVWVGLSC